MVCVTVLNPFHLFLLVQTRMYGMVPSMRRVLWVAFIWVAMVCAMAAVVSCEDLYRVLGVPRSASVREIRRAHKTLAKEW